jgi:uncharacterized membrane protein
MSKFPTSPLAPPLRPARAGAAASLALSGRAVAQGRTLTALGHRVHQTSATTGPGGDATEAWRKQAGATSTGSPSATTTPSMSVCCARSRWPKHRSMSAIC